MANNNMQNNPSSAAASTAEQAKPNWRVVPVSHAIPAAEQAEAKTPELSAMRHRYFGADLSASTLAPASVISSELVTLAPPASAGVQAAPKVVVVQNGKVIGEQG